MRCYIKDILWSSTEIACCYDDAVSLLCAPVYDSIGKGAHFPIGANRANLG